MSLTWTPLGQEPDLLGESPFWHPLERTLYWSDIPGRRLRRYHVPSGRIDTWTMPSEAGCIAPALKGGLVLALRDGIYRAMQWGGPLAKLLDAPHDTQTTRLGGRRPLHRPAVGDGIVEAEVLGEARCLLHHRSVGHGLHRHGARAVGGHLHLDRGVDAAGREHQQRCDGGDEHRTAPASAGTDRVGDCAQESVLVISRCRSAARPTRHRWRRVRRPPGAGSPPRRGR